MQLDTFASVSPLQPQSKVRQVASGLFHGAAVREAGDVFTWGTQALGTGSLLSDANPQRVLLPADVQRVWCSNFATFARCSGGNLFAWGVLPGVFSHKPSFHGVRNSCFLFPVHCGQFDFDDLLATDYSVALVKRLASSLRVQLFEAFYRRTKRIFKGDLCTRNFNTWPLDNASLSIECPTEDRNIFRQKLPSMHTALFHGDPRQIAKILPLWHDSHKLLLFLRDGRVAIADLTTHTFAEIGGRFSDVAASLDVLLAFDAVRRELHQLCLLPDGRCSFLRIPSQQLDSLPQNMHRIAANQKMLLFY